MRFLTLLLAVVRHVGNYVRRAAAGYEPAVVASIVAAVFLLLTQLGISVGDLPDKADAVLRFLQFIAPIVAGVRIRAKVTPAAHAADTGRTPGDVDLHRDEQPAEPDVDDSDEDLVALPGEHRAEG